MAAVEVRPPEPLTHRKEKMELNQGNAIEVLNKLIQNGRPPEYMSSVYDHQGKVRICFRWKDDTCLYLTYSDDMYLMTLKRFMDFWGSALPKTKPIFLKDVT